MRCNISVVLFVRQLWYCPKHLAVCLATVLNPTAQGMTSSARTSFAAASSSRAQPVEVMRSVPDLICQTFVTLQRGPQGAPQLQPMGRAHVVLWWWWCCCNAVVATTMVSNIPLGCCSAVASFLRGYLAAFTCIDVHLPCHPVVAVSTCAKVHLPCHSITCCIHLLRSPAPMFTCPVI